MAVRIRSLLVSGPLMVPLSGGGSVYLSPGEVTGEHYGLVGMRERADAIGAHLTIESRPSWGTRIVVDVTLSGLPAAAQTASGERRSA